MREENLSILRSLKQNIGEIIAPLEAAQSEFYKENRSRIQSSVDLAMSELTMVVLLLTGTDDDVAPRELELLNDMRYIVYGIGIPVLTSSDYQKLCKEFLRLYPEQRLTLDLVPASVRLLLTYDQAHDTEFGNKTRALFVQFAEAIVKADHNEHPVETVRLAHFKEILNSV